MTYAQIIEAFCRAQLGKPYKLGASGPAMWDCSGLTMRAAALMGLKWAHSSHRQYTAEGLNACGALGNEPDGMLFLFHYGKRTNGQMGMIHVGIRFGDTVIQAGGFGGKGVHENPYKTIRKYFSHWATVARANEEITFTGAMQTGSSGGTVACLQAMLNATGAILTVDGNFGPMTQTAVKVFQGAHGLIADGVCDATTWGALVAAQPAPPAPEPEPMEDCPTVRLGSKGKAVEALQAALAVEGFAVTVDGKYGPKTEAAVMAYQAAQGLKADGVCGPKTWSKIQA